MYLKWGKRCLDVVLSLFAIAAMSPLMFLVAVAIWLEDGGPVIFRQQRVGRAETWFMLLKFRSMPVGVASMPSAVAGVLPITRTGRVLRRTNIDELPQLFNILRGEMSIVGPRPALLSQIELLEARRRLGVAKCRPGLTGRAQVESYDSMPEGEKVLLDSRYARDITLLGDLGIILRTVGYLFRRPPVY